MEALELYIVSQVLLLGMLEVEEVHFIPLQTEVKLVLELTVVVMVVIKEILLHLMGLLIPVVEAVEVDLQLHLTITVEGVQVS
jgi:hypothetical protein